MKGTKQRVTFQTPAEAVKFALTPRKRADGTAAAACAGGAGTAELPMLTGYAIVWNATSSARMDAESGQMFYARFTKGSVTFDQPTLAIYSHDAKQVLGNTANGTLRITSDDVGAKVEIDLPDTTYARDVAQLVKDKYINGMSWGGYPAEYDESTETSEDGQPMQIRTYKSALADEVTVTGIPAFVQTTIDAMYEQSKHAHALRLDELRLRMMEL